MRELKVDGPESRKLKVERAAHHSELKVLGLNDTL